MVMMMRRHREILEKLDRLAGGSTRLVDEAIRTVTSQSPPGEATLTQVMDYILEKRGISLAELDAVASDAEP